MIVSKSTKVLLKQLRGFMQNNQYVPEPLQAYIVPSNDAHNSEYLAECDQRRAFISSFTGTAGTAIITENQALLWTDGRYFLQASQQLDESWTLMKEGVPTTPTQGAWLSKNLNVGSNVGVDPRLYAYSKYMSLKTQLETAGHKLVPVETNLIDLIWEHKPSRPANPVKPLGLDFSGKDVKSKLSAILDEMKEKNVKHLVLTALDEIAWFLNLRGSDIQYNPVFFSYIIISNDGTFTLFINPSQVTTDFQNHLKREVGDVFQIKNYGDIVSTLKYIADLASGLVWFSENASYGLASIIPKKRQLMQITPIPLMKAKKNPTEIQGMRNSHIKDAIALCSYFNWLEKNVASGNITEISGAKKLNEFRQQQEHFIGDSFSTISSVGPHAAIIHYQPDESSDVPIRTDAVYLCDSGGQYLDGTTDVTRTIHFGNLTSFEKECFTRVLKGQIKLATRIFPSKIRGNCLDSFAREYLWQVGLDYAHGTGHGIGMYLNVHEGPMGISWDIIPDDPGLEAGMFLSNEPGYYEDGSFGIRIEDIVQVVKANPPHNFRGRGFLTFDTITLVPKQTKMIAVDLLTKDEIAYINDYHAKCREILGPVLDKQNMTETKAWLWKETEPI